MSRDLPAYDLAAGLVRTNAKHVHTIATLLRVGITSNEEAVAANAVSGIHYWLEAASDLRMETPDPPEDLVTEIGIAIASRRNTTIVAALDTATWIFESGRDADKETIKDLAIHGLRYLTQELRYDREHEDASAIPEKRLYCVKLAVAMANSGMEDDPVITRWLEMAREDPLPEVRYAALRQRSHQREPHSP